jgi:hypothetical protein
MLKKISLVVPVLASLLMGCDIFKEYGSQKTAVTITGRVTDAFTNSPIAGARVEFDASSGGDEQVIAESITDNEGQYSLQFMWQCLGSSTVGLRASAEGYQTNNHGFSCSGGSTYQLVDDFKLEPISP